MTTFSLNRWVSPGTTSRRTGDAGREGAGIDHEPGRRRLGRDGLLEHLVVLAARAALREADEVAIAQLGGGGCRSLRPLRG